MDIEIVIEKNSFINLNKFNLFDIRSIIFLINFECRDSFDFVLKYIQEYFVLLFYKGKDFFGKEFQYSLLKEEVRKE